VHALATACQCAGVWCCPVACLLTPVPVPPHTHVHYYCLAVPASAEMKHTDAASTPTVWRYVSGAFCLLFFYWLSMLCRSCAWTPVTADMSTPTQHTNLISSRVEYRCLLFSLRFSEQCWTFAWTPVTAASPASPIYTDHVLSRVGLVCLLSIPTG
jgi:hypothetical protein